MIGFFASNHKNFLPVLGKVARMVERVQEAQPIDSIRCHELTEAVVRELIGDGHLVNRTDGTYGEVAHSWIELSLTVILDVYAVGRFPMVQLVDQCHGLPHQFISYGPSVARTDIYESVVEDLRRQMRGEQ